MALVPADLFSEQIQVTVLETYLPILFAGVSVATAELNQLMEGSGNRQSYREGAEEQHLPFPWLSVRPAQPPHVIPLKAQII